MLLFINYLLAGDYQSLRLKMTLVLIMWFIVAIAIIIDYASGMRKARMRGEIRTSIGMRQTVTKVLQYYSFLTFAFLFDCILMLVLSMFNLTESQMLPFVTMAASCFLVFIEWRSYMEKADEKHRKQMSKSAMDLVELLQNREDIVKGVIEMLNKESIRQENEETNT